MVLAKEETNRSLEEDAEPRSRPTNTVNRSLIKEKRKFNGERIVFSVHRDGKSSHPHVKQVILTDLILLRKIKPKWITDLNVHTN